MEPIESMAEFWTEYRKKPVVIKAIVWAGCGQQIQLPMVRELNDDDAVFGAWGKCSYCGLSSKDHGWIRTLEGGHIVCPGDWVIEGVAGEFYPCKDSIFKMTYEEV